MWSRTPFIKVPRTPTPECRGVYVEDNVWVNWQKSIFKIQFKLKLLIFKNYFLIFSTAPDCTSHRCEKRSFPPIRVLSTPKLKKMPMCYFVNQLLTNCQLLSLNTNSKNLTTNNGPKFRSLHSCLLYLGMVDEFTMSVRRLKIKVRRIIAVLLVFILLIVDWARLVLRNWNFLKTNMTKLLNICKVKT